MSDTRFMLKKYSLDTLISQYLDEIKRLRGSLQNPTEESKLQQYYQAANTFKRVSIKEWIQFAMSYGKNVTGTSAQMRDAFPTVLGNRVQQPSEVDLLYAKLLLDYAKAFKVNVKNLNNWLLRFLLSSDFSPLSTYFQREVDQVIKNTENKISKYNAFLKH